MSGKGHKKAGQPGQEAKKISARRVESGSEKAARGQGTEQQRREGIARKTAKETTKKQRGRPGTRRRTRGRNEASHDRR